MWFECGVVVVMFVSVVFLDDEENYCARGSGSPRVHFYAHLRV